MKEEIQKLIVQNETKKAIRQLLPLAEHQLKKELLILEANYEKLKRENRLFLASRDRLSIDYNKLNDSILEITDKIFDTPKEPDKPVKIEPPQISIQNSKDDSFNLKQRLAFILIGLTIITIITLVIKNKSRIASDTIMVKVKSQNGISLPPKGKVYLTYGNAQIGKEINNNNEAIFTEIPSGYFSEDNHVKISFVDPLGEPYYAIYEDSNYQLWLNKSIELVVGLQGIDRLYGIIKDFDTGDLIDGARISVLDLETYSDKNGWWELEISGENRIRKFHTIRASREGYQIWEREKVPVQTDEEIIIMLKPD